PLEPLPRDLPQRDLVACDLIQYLRLAPPVGQQVDEIEHERAYSLGSDRRAEVPFQLVGVGGRRDLLVADRGLAGQLLEMRLQQLAFVRIQRLVLAIGVPPPIGKTGRDLARKESAEE